MKLFPFIGYEKTPLGYRLRESLTVPNVAHSLRIVGDLRHAVGMWDAICLSWWVFWTMPEDYD
jgi:hypothetical protein